MVELELDWTLDPAETRIMTLLQVRRGRERAIRVPDLASLSGIPARQIQQVIHRLRVQHGQPIASAAGKPAGYYIPETSQEVEEFYHEQKSKALGTLAAAAAVKRTSLPALLGQLALETEKLLACPVDQISRPGPQGSEAA
jgi:hypothetical protein